MNRGNHSLLLMAGFLAVGVIPAWVAAQQLPANATVYGAGTRKCSARRVGSSASNSRYSGLVDLSGVSCAG
jgi:hypothetical protein